MASEEDGLVHIPPAQIGAEVQAPLLPSDNDSHAVPLVPAEQGSQTGPHDSASGSEASNSEEDSEDSDDNSSDAHSDHNNTDDDDEVVVVHDDFGGDDPDDALLHIDPDAENVQVPGGLVGQYIAAIENNEPLFPGSALTVKKFLAGKLHMKANSKQTDAHFEGELRLSALQHPDWAAPKTMHMLKRAVGVRQLWEMQHHACLCGAHSWPPAHPDTYPTLQATDAGSRCPKCNEKGRFQVDENGRNPRPTRVSTYIHARRHTTCQQP